MADVGHTRRWTKSGRLHCGDVRSINDAIFERARLRGLVSQAEALALAEAECELSISKMCELRYWYATVGDDWAPVPADAARYFGRLASDAIDVGSEWDAGHYAKLAFTWARIALDG